MLNRASFQVFNGDITGPEGSAIEVSTAVNGSFEEISGNFTLQYGADNATWSLPFNATTYEVEEALEVRKPSRVTVTSTCSMTHQRTYPVRSMKGIIQTRMRNFALRIRATGEQGSSTLLRCSQRQHYPFSLARRRLGPHS